MLQDALFLHVHLVDLSHLSLLRTRLLVQERVYANHASLHASLFKPTYFFHFHYACVYLLISIHIFLCVCMYSSELDDGHVAAVLADALAAAPGQNLRTHGQKCMYS